MSGNLSRYSLSAERFPSSSPGRPPLSFMTSIPLFLVGSCASLYVVYYTQGRIWTYSALFSTELLAMCPFFGEGRTESIHMYIHTYTGSSYLSERQHI
jgi:hypothetical protein